MCFETDMLLTAAKKYQSLIGSKLVVTVGRKGKQEEIIIAFEAADFCHLAGLHKLKDIQALKGYNTSTILERILNQKLTNEMIIKSSFYGQIEERLKIVSEFPEVLKNDKVIWKFNKVRANAWSKIPWDYLIDYKVQERETYIFLKSNNHSRYFCISAFNRGKMDYTKMQIRMTVLKIVVTSQNMSNTIYQRFWERQRR